MVRAQRSWIRDLAFFLFLILSIFAILDEVLNAKIRKGGTASKHVHALAAPIFTGGARVSVSTSWPASASRRKMLQQAIQTVNVDSGGLPLSKPRPVHPIASPAPSSRPVQAIQTVELDLGSGTGPVQAIQTLSIVSQPQVQQQKSIGSASPYEPPPYYTGFAGDSGYSATPGIGSSDFPGEPWAPQPFEPLPAISQNYPGGTSFDSIPMAVPDVPVGPAGFGRASESSAASSQFPGSPYAGPQQSFSGWPNSMMPSTWWLRSGIDGDDEGGVPQEADGDTMAPHSVPDESGQYGTDLDAYWVVPGVNAPPADSSQTAAPTNWEPPAVPQPDYLSFDDYDFASSLMPTSISIPSYPTPQADGAREPATVMTMGSPALGDIVRLPVPGTATMVVRDDQRRAGPTATATAYSSSADGSVYSRTPPSAPEGQQGFLPAPPSSTSTAGDVVLSSVREPQGQQRSYSSQQPPPASSSSAAAPASYGTNIAIPRQGGGQEYIPAAAYERSYSGMQSGFLLG